MSVRFLVRFFLYGGIGLTLGSAVGLFLLPRVWRDVVQGWTMGAGVGALVAVLTIEHFGRKP